MSRHDWVKEARESLALWWSARPALQRMGSCVLHVGQDHPGAWVRLSGMDYRWSSTVGQLGGLGVDI